MQGLYASLELLPMWSGVEPDAQLFASGRVLDDDGEWAGGQSLGEGSGSSSGSPPCLDANSSGGVHSGRDSLGMVSGEKQKLHIRGECLTKQADALLACRRQQRGRG